MSEPLKYLLLIAATIFMAAGVYIFQPISAGVEAFSKKAPCEQPLSYTIGSIDPRFSISKSELTEAVDDAVAAWNGGSGTELLAERVDNSKQADILIRLVYDDRQERTDREIRLRERIRSQQIRLDRQQIEHDTKRDLFDERSREYREFSARTSASLAELNAWVREKNEDGGFVGDDLREFEQRKKEVEEAQDEVRRRQLELDTMAREINEEMDELNTKFDAHNKLIDQYNNEFAGDLRFAKATYQKTTEGGIVTVNQFINDEELTLIIAHELGHALGISHLRQPEAIMYSQMGAQQVTPTIELTPADIEAATQLCN